jgi:uncharacterized membrane protein YgdD (TMEM256/DUF423 family)
MELQTVERAAACYKEGMNWTATGAVFMALGVGLGAFGAHGLRTRLDAYSMSVYEKAVFYHFVHALGMLLVAALARAGVITPAGQARVSWLLFAGIVIFSGSLYALAISGIRALGAITPIGGLAFIAAWVLLAYEVLRVPRP